MADMECEQCGGTEFYKEAGYFFCKGCQVQSQEVQEYVFEEFRTKTTKVQSEKTEKVDNKITSWECYNYILLGLTDELISLGADKRLKSVIRVLWLRYLEKMRVITLGEDRLPQLQAVGSALDAEIVYGKSARMKRKRHGSSSSEQDSATVDSSSMKRERSKRKRALIKAQYEDFSQKSQGTPSLHNETLTSLQTTSEKSSKHAPRIAYNIYASREFKRIEKSMFHRRRHGDDLGRHLKCHKLSYRAISFKYRRSASVLSLNKLYAILYLGLLIVRDKIQLGDILRFIKEGRLSFNCYSHFFPEDFSDKKLNFRNFKKNRVFANGQFRIVASEMSIFLGYEASVCCPDLVELCERYCRELNLPVAICDCAKNLISRQGIVMCYRRRGNKVPNYEGRVLSIILFVLKLLFGLDDASEFHLGKYAEIFNRDHLVEAKMFNVTDWLKYIEYRNVVLAHEHFPTSFTQGGVRNVNLPLSFLGKKQYPEAKFTAKFHATRDTYKQFLTKVKDTLYEPDTIDFPVTLTPFLDYAKTVRRRAHLEILSADFSADNMDHILKPGKFLEILNRNGHLEVIHGGANDDWVLEKITDVAQDFQTARKERRKLITVKLNFSPPKPNPTKKEAKVDEAKKLQDEFQKVNEHKFRYHLEVLSGKKMLTNLKFSDVPEDFDVTEEYPRHYFPSERFWMRTKLGMEYSNQKDCKKFLEAFPRSFQSIFRECQRIAQQNEHDLLVEYQMTELRLVYLGNYGVKKEGLVKGGLIGNYLKNTCKLW